MANSLFGFFSYRYIVAINMGSYIHRKRFAHQPDSKVSTESVVGTGTFISREWHLNVTRLYQIEHKRERN